MNIEKVKRLVDASKEAELFINDDTAADIMQTEDGTELIVSRTSIVPEGYEVILRAGIVSMWDEEAKMYMPDEFVTIVSEVEEINEGDNITYVTGDFVSAVYEWFNGELPYEQIEQVKCQIKEEKEGN